MAKKQPGIDSDRLFKRRRPSQPSPDSPDGPGADAPGREASGGGGASRSKSSPTEAHEATSPHSDHAPQEATSPQHVAPLSRSADAAAQAPEPERTDIERKGGEVEGEGFQYTSTGYQRADGSVKKRKSLYMDVGDIKALEINARVRDMTEAEYVAWLVRRDGGAMG